MDLLLAVLKHVLRLKELELCFETPNPVYGSKMGMYEVAKELRAVTRLRLSIRGNPRGRFAIDLADLIVPKTLRFAELDALDFTGYVDVTNFAEMAYPHQLRVMRLPFVYNSPEACDVFEQLVKADVKMLRVLELRQVPLRDCWTEAFFEHMEAFVDMCTLLERVTIRGEGIRNMDMVCFLKTMRGATTRVMHVDAAMFSAMDKDISVDIVFNHLKVLHVHGDLSSDTMDILSQVKWRALTTIRMQPFAYTAPQLGSLLARAPRLSNIAIQVTSLKHLQVLINVFLHAIYTELKHIVLDDISECHLNTTPFNKAIHTIRTACTFAMIVYKAGPYKHIWEVGTGYYREVQVEECIDNIWAEDEVFSEQEEDEWSEEGVEGSEVEEEDWLVEEDGFLVV
jgi:hypothetical protein